MKGLLAKTYHANQRISEDTNAYKRAQEEATGQIKALKQKDEIERQVRMQHNVPLGNVKYFAE